MGRWERSVRDDQEELARAKQAEEKRLSEIGKEIKKVEEMKLMWMCQKNILDNMDEGMALV